MNYLSPYEPSVPVPVTSRQRVNAPVYTPVNAPVYTPVSAPVYTPVSAPVYTPVERHVVVMDGADPIRHRGMYTAARPSVCSQYGSSNVQLSPEEYYTGSQWCPVGVLIGEHAGPHSMMALEAQYDGSRWNFRARDTVAQLYVKFNATGTGAAGALRDQDTVVVPGRHGVWNVQIQTERTPYVLYLP